MITRADVERLSRLTSTEWPIISLFLRVDKERIDEDYTIRLKNLLRQAADDLDDRFDSRQRQAVLADLDRIRDFFRDEGSRFGRGVAVIAASNAGIWEVHELPREVESKIVIDFEAHVAPMIRILEQLEPFVTCLISRDSARIFYGRLGTFEQLQQIVDEDVPGQHEQGGWAQARYERHIDEHARMHFKRVADELSRLFEQQPYRWLILGGPDEVVAAFVEQLHPYVRERHAGTVRLLMEANINEVHADSCEIIRRWLRDEKARAIEMLRNEALSGDQGVAGIDATIDALQQGQILTLIVDDSFQAPGAVCQHCGSVQRKDGTDQQCMFCGGPLRQLTDVVAAIVTRAFQQGANLLFLTTPEEREPMEELGRIGALLRYSLSNQTNA
ncbi:MAG: Vms1/Ankzf1 family peptidyl-tRNA hydrolase [Sphaerobacter sp.]|nr:Vms1/Ankzf1 family peptidyl-tRNA hydrolase [Sphaerobacter sp.]